MTRFSKYKNTKEAEEWSAIAFKEAGNCGNEKTLTLGIILALIATSVTTPVTGGLIVVWALWESIKQSRNSKRNQKAVIDSGCVAHILSGDNFYDYKQQVGDSALYEELNWAHERDLKFSNDALDYYEDYIQAPQREQLHTFKELQSVGGTPNIIQTVDTVTFDPSDSKRIDVVTSIAQNMTNCFFLGLGGSGKSMLLANCIKRAKELHPNLKVMVMDAKANSAEAGYYQFCDKHRPFKCENAKPGAVAVWAESMVQEYLELAADNFAQTNGKTLCIWDDGYLVAHKLKQAKSTAIIDQIVGSSSVGGLEGRIIWFVSQSPYVKDMGMSLGQISQMNTIVVTKDSQIGQLQQWKHNSLFSFSLDELGELTDCQSKRSIYLGSKAQWYEMPVLENYSSFDRDTRTSFTENSSPTKIQEIKDDSVARPAGAEQFKLSELAQRLLSFFDNAKNKEPKTLADLKKKDELRNQGDVKLIRALDELVRAEEVIFDGDKETWSKCDW